MSCVEFSLRTGRYCCRSRIAEVRRVFQRNLIAAAPSRPKECQSCLSGGPWSSLRVWEITQAEIDVYRREQDSIAQFIEEACEAFDQAKRRCRISTSFLPTSKLRMRIFTKLIRISASRTVNVQVTNFPTDDSKYRVAWDMTRAIAREELSKTQDREYFLRLVRQCVMALDTYDTIETIEEVVEQKRSVTAGVFV